MASRVWLEITEDGRMILLDRIYAARGIVHETKGGAWFGAFSPETLAAIPTEGER